MKNISDNITYREATKSITASRKGIKNVPNTSNLKAMRYVAEGIFEPTRLYFSQLFGKDIPIRITSFFRSLLLNIAVGGSRFSDHMKGRAIDMECIEGTGITNADIFYYILENLDFDQLIWEYGTDEEPDWVHASLRNGTNRKQVKRAYLIDGEPVHKFWTPPFVVVAITDDLLEDSVEVTREKLDELYEKVLPSRTHEDDIQGVVDSVSNPVPIIKFEEPQEEREEPLAVPKGCFNGMLLSSVIWIIVYYLFA